MQERKLRGENPSKLHGRITVIALGNHLGTGIKLISRNSKFEFS